ncbi:hypothetical protein GCM10010384_10250 [Streptomyces djakartensis]|uniref:Uncharacterized protein n=1 Tax=Streptomyces djakartensis TaxID=68193 RepID=A0ABQ2Z834_9ACTN|nr:hypothetical protein GCM10010384_10250 [Streptomyces djakartensis]
MPEPVECRDLRSRIRALARELKRVLNEAKTEPLAEARRVLLEKADRLERQIDDTRAQMEEAGCDLVPADTGMVGSDRPRTGD